MFILATITATSISASSIPTLQSGDTISHTDINNGFSTLRTMINSIVTDLGTLNTADGGLGDANTWTAVNTFNAGIAFEAGDGINDTFLLIDADNTGAATTCSLRMQRGSSGADAYLTWDTTRWNFYTDDATTRSVVRVADGAAANDCMTYGQGIKATGTVAETVTGVKTFDSYPAITTYAAPTSNTQFAPKKYVDDQTSSLVTGGILQQTTAPATTNNNLWIDTTSAANYKFHRANGTAFAPVTGIHQGTSAPTSPAVASGHLWIDTTSTDSSSLKRYDGSAWKQVLPATIDAATTFTGAVTMSASTVFSLGFSVAASQTIDFNANRLQEVADPTAAQDAATKNYVDSTASVQPTDLIGCKLWLKASDIAGADGTAVSAWNDASGNAYNFVQATGANQPTLKTGANGINSQNVVRFDGTTDFMTSTATVENIVDGTAGTAIIVAKIGSALATDAILCDSGANYVLGINATGWRMTSEAETENVAVSVSTSYILWAKHDGTNFYTRINRTVWPAGSGDGIIGTLTGTLILGDRTGATEFFTGDIAEILIFDRVLDEGECALMRTYLNNRYAIY